MGKYNKYAAPDMSAGSNTVNYTVPPGWDFRVDSLMIYNPDAAARVLTVYLTDASGNYLALGLAAVNVAASSYLTTKPAVQNLGGPVWLTEGQKISFVWAGMTGSNQAKYSFNGELVVHKSAA